MNHVYPGQCSPSPIPTVVRLRSLGRRSIGAWAGHKDGNVWEENLADFSDRSWWCFFGVLVFFFPKLCNIFAVNSSAVIVIGVSIIIKRDVRKVRVFSTSLIWMWSEQDFSTFYTWVRKYQLTWLKTIARLVTICLDKTSVHSVRRHSCSPSVLAWGV